MPDISAAIKLTRLRARDTDQANNLVDVVCGRRSGLLASLLLAGWSIVDHISAVGCLSVCLSVCGDVLLPSLVITRSLLHVNSSLPGSTRLPQYGQLSRLFLIIDVIYDRKKN